MFTGFEFTNKFQQHNRTPPKHPWKEIKIQKKKGTRNNRKQGFDCSSSYYENEIENRALLFLYGIQNHRTRKWAILNIRQNYYYIQCSSQPTTLWPTSHEGYAIKNIQRTSLKGHYRISLLTITQHSMQGGPTKFKQANEQISPSVIKY